MLTHSDSVAKIGAALVKFAAAIENPHKNATNPHFKNRYADLAEIINTSRVELAKHGVTVIQCPGMIDGMVTVSSMLLHESGEWIQGVASSPIPKADPQGVGSATTYLRRYSLAALLGLAQEDDDGEGAGQGKAEEPSSMRALTGEAPAGKPRPSANGTPALACPDCGGPMWDNRLKKQAGTMKEKSPDLSCKDREKCGKAIWLDGWRAELLQKAAIAHDMGEIDAHEREQMEQAAKGMDPSLMLRVARKLSELIPA